MINLPNRPHSSVFVAFSLVFLGCGTTRLTLAPLDPHLLLSHIRAATESSHSVHVAEFSTDNTPEAQNRMIGEANTGAFYRDAEIIATEPVGEIMRRALQMGLERSGIRLEAATESDFILEGSLEKFWVNEHIPFYPAVEYSRASVRYAVVLKNRGNDVVWASSFEGHESAGLPST